MEALLVCRHEDGAIVGVYNVSQIHYGGLRSAYLGYYAFTPFSGHGYMHEGIRLTLRHAFGPLRLHRLEANIQPDNAPSLALVKRAASAWRDTPPVTSRSPGGGATTRTMGGPRRGPSTPARGAGP